MKRPVTEQDWEDYANRNKPVRKVPAQPDRRKVNVQRLTWRKRFWENVDKGNGPDDCWIWTGRISKAPRNPVGYGAFSVPDVGGDMAAHRIAYELVRERIAPGLVIDHEVCGNTLCVNPFHLEAVTYKRNSETRSRIAFLGVFPYRRAWAYFQRENGSYVMISIHATKAEAVRVALKRLEIEILS